MTHYSHDTVASEDELDALETLHTRIADSLAGFETMVAKAEPAFRPVAEAFHGLHQRLGTEVARLLAEAGRTPDAGGSLMGTINRAVVATRAFVDEIDADVMEEIHSGERHVLDAFEQAIDHTSDKDRVTRLRRMREELAQLLAAHPAA